MRGEDRNIRSRQGGVPRRPPAADVRPPLDLAAIARLRRPPGFFGAFVAAILGTTVGVAGALVSGQSSEAEASLSWSAALDLRDAPLTAIANTDSGRSALIARILDEAPERLSIGAKADTPAARPKLIVIIDDMGLDREAFREIAALPGPLTLSFLPYADDVQPLVEAARADGDAILLHLPMAPSGAADAGPHSLDAGMSAEKLFKELGWNLDRFDGYVGVNNHMGSKFTKSEPAMQRVLAMLEERGLFFIDSLTTGDSAAAKAGAAVGADVFVRDVFLDAEPGRDAVRRQLDLAERIAATTGYAIVICHPRPDTLEMIGPWLTTAPARGFDLATVGALRGLRYGES